MQIESTLTTDKRCVRCFETKPADAFYVVRSRGIVLGLSAQCRRCHNGGPAHPDYRPILTGRPRFPHRPSMLPRTCVVCGVLFEARQDAVARGWGLVCGRPCANKLRKIPEADRFSALVAPADANGCRHWLAAVGRGGYGRFTGDAGRQVESHRYAFQREFGPIPIGMSICHRCDVFYPVGDITYRRCVEPTHLFLGTTQANLEDRDVKRRQAMGERSGQAKLTDEAIREMRRLRTTGWGQQKIADRFGVSQQVVSHILRRLSWKHVL
jgi:hypothetical protein